MGVSISEFRGEYYFLSNFYSAPVTYNGMCFENNEAAFQAAKCPERMTEFCRLNPSEAKRLGRRVKLRGDWEAVKDTVMYEICKAKFSQNPCFKNHFYGSFHLYGHVHNSFEWNMMEHDKYLMEELYTKPCQMFNVGVMMPWMDYTPRTLDEIIAANSHNKAVRNK